MAAMTEPVLKQSPNGNLSNPDLSLLMDNRTNDTIQMNNEARSCCLRTRQFFRRNILMSFTVAAIILGFGVGFAVRIAEPSPTAILWLGIPGELFLNLLKMTIIPLVVSSVISATASMDPKENGKISAILLSYLVLTNFMGATLGIVMGLIVKPGAGVTYDENLQEKTISSGLQTSDIMADLLRNVIPQNLIRATIQKARTTYKMVENTDVVNTSAGLVNITTVEMVRGHGWSNSVNVLGLIFGCVLFGLACSQIKENGEPFLAFFKSTLQIVLLILQWLLWTAPVGIFSLIASSIAVIDDIGGMFAKLGMFSLAVLACTLIHQIVLLPLIYLVTCRRNPLKVYIKSAKAWFVCFSAASCGCAMPYMYQACDKMGIHRKMYTFGIPTAVTFNGDGSAFFICISCQFLSEISGTSLDGSELVIILLLASVFTLAIPAVPSASLVLIVIICTTINIPPETVGLLFAVEWLLDRLRSSSNLMGMIMAVAITSNFCGRSFDDPTPPTLTEHNVKSDHCKEENEKSGLPV